MIRCVGREQRQVPTRRAASRRRALLCTAAASSRYPLSLTSISHHSPE